MTVPSREDFATEVRTDRLRTLWQVTLVGSAVVFVLLLVVGPMSRQYDVGPLVLALLSLSFGCILTASLLRRNYFVPAVWAYAMGCIVAVTFLMISGDKVAMQLVPFIFPVVVFIVGLLLSPFNTFLMAFLATFVVLVMPGLVHGDWDYIGAHQIFAIILLFISALLSAQVTGELYQITEWALMNYQKERRTNDELYEKRMALQRSLLRSQALSNELQETNVELEGARAAAEEAKHFRGQFLANMSHELRTPLNAIIGFSETMLQFPMMYDNTPLPTMYNNDMSQIYSSGRQLLHVINDILDLAKVDAGKLDVQMRAVGPEPIVLAAISTAKGLIGGKSIILDKDLPQPMPMIWGDETRLRQVLLNLYSNAAKFTEEGTIKLTVREVPEGVQFSLSDTGCGISAENQGIIFEEFKQASPKGRDPRSGSGLGLTISRQLLDLMGGRIWVESEVGKGSTFHFIVQKYTGQDKVEASPAPEEKPVAQPAPKAETLQPEPNPAPAAVNNAQEPQKSLAEAPAQQLAVTSASQEEEV